MRSPAVRQRSKASTFSGRCFPPASILNQGWRRRPRAQSVQYALDRAIERATVMSGAGDVFADRDRLESRESRLEQLAAQ